MIDEAELQAIVDGKREVPLANTLVLWNEPGAGEYGFEPVGVLVLPQSPAMDCPRTKSLYVHVVNRYLNSRGNCTSSWIRGTTQSRVAELREIADDMVENGLSREVVDAALAVIPEWREHRPH